MQATAMSRTLVVVRRFLSLCNAGGNVFIVWPRMMSKVGYMAHRQKVLHTPGLNKDNYGRERVKLPLQS